MFEEAGLLAHFGISSDRLRTFVRELAKRYNRVPYHHFTHTFSLMQMCYSFLRVAKHSAAGPLFNEAEELALYIAALGHDLGHCKLCCFTPHSRPE